VCDDYLYVVFKYCNEEARSEYLYIVFSGSRETFRNWSFSINSSTYRLWDDVNVYNSLQSIKSKKPKVRQSANFLIPPLQNKGENTRMQKSNGLHSWNRMTFLHIRSQSATVISNCFLVRSTEYEPSVIRPIIKKVLQNLIPATNELMTSRVSSSQSRSHFS
jgi:hypothetical protein